MAFPYIFRGALDTRSNAIDLSMKMAATQALIDITRESPLSENYIVPPPHHPKLLQKIPYAVAQAAIKNNRTNYPFDLEHYQSLLLELSERI